MLANLALDKVIKNIPFDFFIETYEAYFRIPW